MPRTPLIVIKITNIHNAEQILIDVKWFEPMLYFKCPNIDYHGEMLVVGLMYS